MRLLSAAIFCIYLPILVTPFSAFARSKTVRAANLCVIEIMRETNATPTPVVGGWEFASPKIEDSDVDWNPTWLGNKATANLFCKMLGLGDAMKIEGSLTPYMEWQFGHGGKSLSDAGFDWVKITKASGRFRFDKIQCQEKFGSTMSTWLEAYITGRTQNIDCK